MPPLQNVLQYIARKYPHPEELSNARLTKLVYLADWRSCLTRGKQITGLKWFFHNYGPFLPDIQSCAEAHPDLFIIEKLENYRGNPKTLFRDRPAASRLPLDPSVAELLDHVIDRTEKLNWEDFIRLVYGTYPIVASSRFTDLDLPALADEWNSKKASPTDERPASF